MKSTLQFKNVSTQPVTIRTSALEIKEVAKRLGASFHSYKPEESDSRFEFEFETDDGDFFMVYDRNEEDPSPTEILDFYIAAKDRYTALIAKSELEIELEKNS